MQTTHFIPSSKWDNPERHYPHFLQHILEATPARMDEINGDRRRVGREKLAQGGVILSAENACGRQVGDNTA